jgi:hypothetical protein
VGVLTQRTRDKLNTPKWKSLRDLFIQVAEPVLNASPDAQGDLAGNYIKFATGPAPTSPTYAAVWPKVTLPKRLIVGLALPEGFEAAGVGPPPERIFYQGITKFLVIEEGQAVPEELSTWAELAYDAATH